MIKKPVQSWLTISQPRQDVCQEEDLVLLDPDEVIQSISYGRSNSFYNNFPCHLSIRTNKQFVGPFSPTNCSIPHLIVEIPDNVVALDFLREKTLSRSHNGSTFFDGFKAEKYHISNAEGFIGYYFDTVPNPSKLKSIQLEFRSGL